MSTEPRITSRSPQTETASTNAVDVASTDTLTPGDATTNVRAMNAIDATMNASTTNAIDATMNAGAMNAIDASRNSDDCHTLFETAWEITRSDPERAFALVDEAVALASATSRAKWVFRRTVVHAAVAYARSEYTKGLELQRPLNLDNEPDDEWRARTLVNLAHCHEGLAEYAHAIEAYGAALELYERLNIPNAISRVLNMIGGAHQSLGNVSDALEAFQRAYAIDEALDDKPALASVLNRIGNVHNDMGDYETALDYCERGLAMAEAAGDQRMIGVTVNDVATTYARLGQHQKALDLLLRGMEMWRASGSKESVGVALVNIGTEYKNLGDIDAAREAYAEGLRISEEIGARMFTGVVLADIGILEHVVGNLDAALDSLHAGLAIANDIGARSLAVGCHEELSKVYRDADMYRDAYEHQSKHYSLTQEIRTDETRRKLQQLESTRELELARKEAEIERLRNVELAESNTALRVAHEALATAHNNLKAAQTQLVQAEKMASLGQLTAGIAHEINNPINFIRASAGPLRRDLDEVRAIVARSLQRLPEDLRLEVEDGMAADADELHTEIDSLLRGIEDGATRTAEIVKGLRSFSRLGEDQLKVVDLHEGIDSALVLLKSKLAKSIEVRREFGDIPDVECFPGQINQVFMNILANAIDALEEGPKVQGSKGPGGGGGGVIAVRTSCTESHVQIAIADNGCGIAAEHMPKIFEPFFTTKPVGKGQGLGLAISHGIVERHSGSIAVNSATSTGTTFTVMLPVAQPQ